MGGQVYERSKKAKKSAVLSLRLQSEQLSRLGRMARRQGKTVAETANMLIEEGLRRSEFSLIDFRDSSGGRRACLQGSSLAIWEIILVCRSYNMDLEKTAAHSDWPAFRLEAAINYWKAFPQEIELAIQDSAAFDYQQANNMLPQLGVFQVAKDRVLKVREGIEKQSGKRPGRTKRD
jgi:hypothetical protein